MTTVSENLRNLDELRRAYARLIVRLGLNLQAGHRLIIFDAPVEAVDFVALIAQEAYGAGARLVDPLWTSDSLIQARFSCSPRDSFGEYPGWRIDALLQAAETGDAVLLIPSTNPDLMKDQDPTLVAQLLAGESRSMRPFSAWVRANRLTWSVASIPTPAWAAKVFPTPSPAAGLERLWRELMTFCGADKEDPVVSWGERMELIGRRKGRLTAKRYVSLHLRGPGTDLTVGLPPRHLWHGGEVSTPQGIVFSPNIPTEEVFTLPDRLQVDGVVTATRPLHHDGLCIEGLTLTFTAGRVSAVTAQRGAEALGRLIAADEGAARLGEVAIVASSSAIAQSGLTFFNPLIDENAACHLALGYAYRFCLQDGPSLTDDEFLSAGGNESSLHLDFMVGSGELKVAGVTRTGKEEEILRDGEWTL